MVLACSVVIAGYFVRMYLRFGIVINIASGRPAIEGCSGAPLRSSLYASVILAYHARSCGVNDFCGVPADFFEWAIMAIVPSITGGCHSILSEH